MAVVIRDTEILLTDGISLFGGLPKPPNGLGMVLLHPLAGCMNATEVVLSAGICMLGGLPVPALGLGIVFFHPSTVRVHDTRAALSACTSSLGRAPPQPKRLVLFPLLCLGQSAPRRIPTAIRRCTSKYRRVASSNSCSGPGGGSTRQMGNTCLMPNDRSPSTHAAWGLCEQERAQRGPESSSGSRQMAHSSAL